MKKLFSTIIVFLMAFALMVPAGASNKVDPKDNPEINPDTKSGSIIIAKKGSEFSVYKILNAEAKKGQNVFNYTANSNFEGFFGNSDYDNLTIKDIAAMPNELNKRDDNGNITDPITSATTKLTNPLQKYISDMGIEPVTTISCPNDGSSVTVNLEIGFYLIVETGTHSDSASVASKSMLVPLPMVETTNGTNAWNYNLNITPKDEPVNITKKIVEDDNRVDESTNFIGREINYEIKADIPHYDASTDIDSVKYVMTDTLSKGLDFVKDDVVVVVSGGGLEDKTLENGTDYEIAYSEDNKTMTITYTYINIMDYTDVTVTYAAKLNENALIGGGDLANPNKIELEYTNTPSTWDTSKPSDEVKSFTYGVQINKVDEDKVDENNNAIKLEGAEFVLLDDKHQPIAAYTYKGGEVVVLQNEEVVRTDANGLAYFVGLDAGTYYLRETKAPDGYVLLDGDVKLEIRVINETTGEAEYYLNNELLTTTASIENGGEIASVPTNSQVAVGTIGNSEGFNLPMTGGAGTWMFTVGGILIMASMITVFVKLRKKEN